MTVLRKFLPTLKANLKTALALWLAACGGGAGGEQAAGPGTGQAPEPAEPAAPALAPAPGSPSAAAAS